MKLITYKKNGFLMLLIASTIVAFALTGCISDADDEDTPARENDTIIIDTDTTSIRIDSLFRCGKSFIQREWMAEYAGFDSAQNVISSIRRFMRLSQGDIYECHVQGIVNTADTFGMKELEHEAGTFVFDEERQTLTYLVDYDSLINFESGKMEFHPEKMWQDGTMDKTYNERVWFTNEHDGKRGWIRVDDNLYDLSNHDERLIYQMKSSQ